MSISSKRSRQALKTALVYLGVTAFCVLFSTVYAQYAHGVASASMSLLFLYPLLGGVLGFLLVWLFVPAADRLRHYRAAYNLYNSGLATLLIGSALRGVFEIAGTSSPHTVAYPAAGWLLVGLGLLVFCRDVRRRRRAFRPTRTQRETIDSFCSR